MDLIETKLLEADVFLCAGTSGVVYPAAGFVQPTPSLCRKIEFNLEPTAISDLFDQTILGKTGETLPQWIDELLQTF